MNEAGLIIDSHMGDAFDRLEKMVRATDVPRWVHGAELGAMGATAADYWRDAEGNLYEEHSSNGGMSLYLVVDLAAREAARLNEESRFRAAMEEREKREKRDWRNAK